MPSHHNPLPWVKSQVNALLFPTNTRSRKLTIEEVSLIFDTGRLGDSAAVTAELSGGTKVVGDVDDKHAENRVDLEAVPDHVEHKRAQ